MAVGTGVGVGVGVAVGVGVGVAVGVGEGVGVGVGEGVGVGDGVGSGAAIMKRVNSESVDPLGFTVTTCQLYQTPGVGFCAVERRIR